MKILYFHQYFSTPKGAGGTRSYLLAKKLVNSGHKVKMVCLNDSRSDSGINKPFVNGKRIGFVDDIEVLELNIRYSNKRKFYKRIFIFFIYCWKSIKLALEEEVDLIVATSTPLTVGIPGIFAYFFKKTPLVFEVRDLWPELPKELGIIKNPLILFLAKQLERFTYKTAKACIGLAPGICEGIKKGGATESKVYLIPNFCDNKLFYPLRTGNKKKKPNKEISSNTVIPKDSLIAAYTGAHGLCNDLNSIVNVAIELKKRKIDNIHIFLIGEGSCKGELIKKSKIYKLKNIHFLPSMKKEKLSEFIRLHVHVGLMLLKNVPAFYNGTSPNKFFDYLASGLCVVTNYPGWISDLISKEKLGINVQPNNPKVFANQLIKLSNNRKLLESYSKKSRLLAERDFSSDYLSGKWVKVIEGVQI